MEDPEEEEEEEDQKERLMSGAWFSLLSSGLHLMSGEVRSISCRTIKKDKHGLREN